MAIIKYVFPLILFFLILETHASSNHENDNHSFFNKEWTQLASIKFDNITEGFKLLSNLDIDIAGVDHNNSRVDVLINEYDYHLLASKGLELIIRETKGVSQAPDEDYKTPDEIELFVKEYADRFPAIAKRVSIGKSLEGRDIWAIKISDNPELEETDEPAILFNSMHHAREVMGPEVSIDIVETLLNGYNTDQKITDWVDNNQIWVIPMFNVDGNNKMWTKDKWWRKNTRGGYGVDLNRNYPGNWDKCNGSSGWRSSQTYRGPSPASEPETQAMMKLVSEVRPVFDISYHSYSELVIYPLGCADDRTATKEVVEKIGKEIAQKINYKPGTAWELLYNADGGDIDWMYLAYQVIPFVIELNASSEGFHPDYNKWRDVTVQRNKAGWMHLLDKLSDSGVRGILSQNSTVVSDYYINVYKAGNNTDVFQKYIGHISGAFHLVLNPGEYNLEFIVDDNIVKKVKVEIGDSLKRLNVSL